MIAFVFLPTTGVYQSICFNSPELLQHLFKLQTSKSSQPNLIVHKDHQHLQVSSRQSVVLRASDCPGLSPALPRIKVSRGRCDVHAQGTVNRILNTNKETEFPTFAIEGHTYALHSRSYLPGPALVMSGSNPATTQQPYLSFNGKHDYRLHHASASKPECQCARGVNFSPNCVQIFDSTARGYHFASNIKFGENSSAEVGFGTNSNFDGYYGIEGRLPRCRDWNMGNMGSLRSIPVTCL